MARSVTAFVLLVALAASPSQRPRSIPRTCPTLTAQVPDLLVLDADTLGMFSNPLESAFSDTNPRPEYIFPDGCISTACWRGYQAVWGIVTDSLFLTSVRSCCDESTLSASRIENLLGRRSQNGRVFADWYTGHLIVAIGERVHYVHMGYASTYDEYLLLTVVGGGMTKKFRANERAFRRFREEQFRQFMKTDFLRGGTGHPQKQ